MTKYVTTMKDRNVGKWFLAYTDKKRLNIKYFSHFLPYHNQASVWAAPLAASPLLVSVDKTSNSRGVPEQDLHESAPDSRRGDVMDNNQHSGGSGGRNCPRYTSYASGGGGGNNGGSNGGGANGARRKQRAGRHSNNGLVLRALVGKCMYRAQCKIYARTIKMEMTGYQLNL